MDGPADSLEVFYSPHETWTEGASSQQTYGGSDQPGAAGWILCPLWQFLRHRAFGKSLLYNHIQEALIREDAEDSPMRSLMSLLLME